VPTVGFATGGVPDMVNHDSNGWLAPTGDIAGLVKGLRIAATERERWSDWSNQATADAREKYSPELFLQSHAELYERLTGVPSPVGQPSRHSEALPVAS
jgi:glycosyltransferase involved in cell wall biosynthesis